MHRWAFWVTLGAAAVAFIMQSFVGWWTPFLVLPLALALIGTRRVIEGSTFRFADRLRAENPGAVTEVIAIVPVGRTLRSGERGLFVMVADRRSIRIWQADSEALRMTWRWEEVDRLSVSAIVRAGVNIGRWDPPPPWSFTMRGDAVALEASVWNPLALPGGELRVRRLLDALRTLKDASVPVRR